MGIIGGDYVIDVTTSLARKINRVLLYSAVSSRGLQKHQSRSRSRRKAETTFNLPYIFLKLSSQLTIKLTASQKSFLSFVFLQLTHCSIVQVSPSLLRILFSLTHLNLYLIRQFILVLVTLLSIYQKFLSSHSPVFVGFNLHGYIS